MQDKQNPKSFYFCVVSKPLPRLQASIYERHQILAMALVKSSAFYGEFYGHPPQLLEQVFETVVGRQRAAGKAAIFLAGDSTIDNKCVARKRERERKKQPNLFPLKTPSFCHCHPITIIGIGCEKTVGQLPSMAMSLHSLRL